MELRTLDGYEQAKEALRRFLENDSESSNASKAWKLLGHACYQTGDALGEIHAFIERGKDLSVPFYDLSNTANRLNLFLGGKGETLDREQKRYFATRILAAMDKRRSEATPDDLSRMGWLAIRSGQEHLAREYVEIASSTDPGNYHIQNLRIVLGMTSA